MKCRVFNGMESKESNRFFANKGNCGKRFGALLYYLKQFSFPIKPISSSILSSKSIVGGHLIFNVEFEFLAECAVCVAS